MRAERATALADRALDAAVVGYAAWTLGYLVAYLARLPAFVAPVLTAVVLVGTTAYWRRLAGSVRTEEAIDHPGSIPIAVPIGIALVAVAGALARSGAAFWLAALAAVAAGLWMSRRGRRASVPSAEGYGPWLVGTLALGVGLISVLVRTPSVDDAFYLNRMLAVSSSPTAPFPIKDTMHGDQVFAEGIGIDTLSAFEPLVGALGWIVPVDVRTLLYLVVAPVLAATVVLATWRLLRSLETVRPALATAVAVVVLGVDGAFMQYGGAPITKTFQGKIVLWLAMVPLLWHFVTRYITRGGTRALVLLLATVVASLGLSSSALLVVPIVLAGAALSGAFVAETRRRGVVVAGLVLAPALLGVVGASLQGGTTDLLADRARDTVLEAWDLSVDRPRYVLGAAVVILAGWTAIRRPTARRAMGLAVLGILVLTHPLALRVMEQVGLGAVVPRLKWAIPDAALVGAVAVAPLVGGRGPRRLAAVLAIGALIVASYAVGREPLPGWPSNAVGRPDWDLPPRELAAARELVALAPPGSVVVAPTQVSAVVPMTTVDTYPLSVRRAYSDLIGRREGASFDAAERWELTKLMSTGLRGNTTPEAESRSLRSFGVEAACARPRASEARQRPWRDLRQAFSLAGLEHHHTDLVCSYWVRAPSSR